MRLGPFKAALDEYAACAPPAESAHRADRATARQTNSRVRKAQQGLLASVEHQARLILVNANDHLNSMARLLGSDGAMSLFSHTTLSRSVCEAAIRHAWLTDSSISYEVRITRTAAMLYYGAENKLRGAKQSLVRESAAPVRQLLIDKCTAEFDQVCELIGRAGMNLGLGRDGRTVARVELRNSNVKVPVKFEAGPLMESLLTESPGWYLLSSGVSHSAPWLLDTAVIGGRGSPELQLTPDLLEVAAAAQTAISASALIIERHATYYGFDPEPYVRKSRSRRGILDALMREQAIRQATNPAPFVPATTP